MSLPTLLLVLVSVTLSACAQLLLKVGVTAWRGQPPALGPASISAVPGMLFHPGILGGLALYGLGMVLWLLVLNRVALSQAYPFVGLGFVLTALFGALALQEPFGPGRLLGTALIVGGVVVVARS